MSWRARLTSVCAIAYVLCLTTAIAGAQTSGPCVVVVDDTQVGDHTEPGSAYEVDANDSVRIVVVSQTGDPIVASRVELQFGPVRIPLTDERVDPAPAWAGRYDVADATTLGIGLHRVEATARLASGGTCSGAMWFDVTGRSPFTTVAGIGGTVVAVLGLGLAIAGLRRAAHGRGGLPSAALGGAFAGIGALVIAQQSGMVPIDGDSVMLWIAAPGAGGAVLQQIVTRLAGQTEDEAAPSTPGPSTPGPSTPGPAREAEPGARAESRDIGADAMAPTPPPMSRPGGIRLPRREPSVTDRAPDQAPDDATVATAPIGAAPVTPSEAQPPRSAYARLDCPDVVVRDTEFELVVGLAATPTTGVIGDELRIPDSVTGPYTLTVQVVADGFGLRQGELWRVELPVTGAEPYPVATLHLIAFGSDESIVPRAIRAMFSIDGQTLGMAYRSIAVVRNLELLGQPDVEENLEPGVDLSVPTAWTPPDLTIRIVEGESENGRLLWTFETPWQGVDVPDEPLATHIGDGEEPRAFTRRLVDAVNAREGKPGLYQYLIGVARSVADQMPERFWELWSEVAKRTGDRPPSVLILSEEPYIPWELAETRPPIDRDAPPFLSAQAAVGRWVLGHRRPPLPPPMEASISPMVAIWGVYNRPGWNRLVKAEEEASRFTSVYGAVTVNAAANDVLKCLEGTPPADLMHFAVHGVYDPTGTQDGLILTDGHVLDPLQVKGSTFSGTPFVFLNACQVGSGNKILGDYAGLAEAFLYSGAAGVVAPLWSVQDTIAKDLALYFYEKAFGGESVGEVLRRQRAMFTKSDDPISATYLAYQYFGHPQMRLTRVLRTEEGESWQSSTQTGTQSASATS